MYFNDNPKGLWNQDNNVKKQESAILEEMAQSPPAAAGTEAQSFENAKLNKENKRLMDFQILTTYFDSLVDGLSFLQNMGHNSPNKNLYFLS